MASLSVSSLRFMPVMRLQELPVNPLTSKNRLTRPICGPHTKLNPGTRLAGLKVKRDGSVSEQLASGRGVVPRWARRVAGPQKRELGIRSQSGLGVDGQSSSGESAASLLLVPVKDKGLIDARIVFAAAPSMGHNQEGHPESNQRVPAILEALEAARLTPKARGKEVVQLEGFGEATPEQVAAVHTAGYVHGLEKAMERAAEEGLILVESTGPTYATAFTYNECMRAAGAGLAVVDSVVAASRAATGQSSAGFALVRPPGHHAVPQGPMGFCLVDHIAVAARHAQQVHGLRRVMIVDFDVHHGNGTHDMFYADPDIFFLSTHQLGSYPGTGRMEEVGEGAGEGTTLNLPLPGGAGDEAMMAVLEEVIAPAALRFKPDIILVSAGYDAHFQDPLAGLQFTTGTYHRLTTGLHQLAKQLCNGRIVFFLEGGYDLKSLSNSITDTFRAFLGEKSISPKIDNPAMLYDEPSVLVQDAIDRIKSIHSL